MDELDWPAQSPDLNPIQHLWDELDCQVQIRAYCPTSMADLTDALVAEWQQIAAARFKNLVENIPRRVDTIIVAY